MTTPITSPSISRRAALAGIGAGGLGLAVAATSKSAAAQDVATPTANHPGVGAWMVMNPVPNIGVINGDGTIINVGVINSVGPDQAVGFGSPGAGTWEALDDRAIHVTFVEFHTDAAGASPGPSRSMAIQCWPKTDKPGSTTARRRW